MDERCIIVGGGLAGLLCARRLLRRGRPFLLLDAPVGALGKGLGGFAEFSGAKFSLLPAGSGLVPVAGSEQALRTNIEEVVDLLGLSRFPLVRSSDVALNGLGLDLRAYDSYVLSPAEVRALVYELSSSLPSDAVLHGRAVHVRRDGEIWRLRTENGGNLTGETVVFAGGRTGASLLASAGAKEQPGRGIDFGVRIEFVNRAALDSLRALGADAKLISGRCRTFCLNSPGQVFHYIGDSGVVIPGGVVADHSVNSGNVGLLCRVTDKQQALARFSAAAKQHVKVGTAHSYFAADQEQVVNEPELSRLFGPEVVSALAEFVRDIDAAGLIRFSDGCTVHYPLIDWHWPTFAVGASFTTTRERLYVVGDLAGHARGLLQGAVSGWMAGELV